MSTMDWILQYKIITIVRSLGPDATGKLADALYEGGIRLMEVTFAQAHPDTWKDTAASIRGIGERYAGKMLVGAGTVLTPEQLRMAADAGAKYIISPDVNVEIILETKQRGLLSLPGALTPTEIMTARRAGADAVKVFPAGSLGTGYIKAVRAPLSHVPLLAVGGVNVDNCADFIAAGCAGVGVGGSLVNKQWIANREYGKIAALAAAFTKALA